MERQEIITHDPLSVIWPFPIHTQRLRKTHSLKNPKKTIIKWGKICGDFMVLHYSLSKSVHTSYFFSLEAAYVLILKFNLQH